MAAIVSRQLVIDRVARDTEWWTAQRMDKLREGLHETMAVNPFLIAILWELHHAESFDELAELLLAGHLMTGHSTRFGKLVDERILPNMFGTKKLTAEYRAAYAPFAEPCFDDIDHVVPRPGAKPALLSLKASKWTIQLAAAVTLNRQFSEIERKHGSQFSEVVVGVFYGKQSTLTDKYDIARGINRGKNHAVADLRHYVKVLAGRGFWSWMNGDEPATQDWVLDGILAGLRSANCRSEAKELLAEYKAAFGRLYAGHVGPGGAVDWHAILSEING